MAWYKTGDEGAESAKQEDDRRQAQFSGKAQRFWLAPDKSTKILFLDTKGFYFREHQLNLNGSWLNWETCISDIGEEDCPICEAGFKYSYVCAFTIIDLSKYKDKKGNLVTARKKLIMFKSNARNKILKRKEKLENDLTGCVFEVTRYNEKEANTGEDFEFLRRVDLEEAKEFCPDGDKPDEFIQAYDYMKLFEPKSAAELRKVIGAAPPVGAEDAPSSKKAAEGGDRKEAKSLKDLI